MCVRTRALSRIENSLHNLLITIRSRKFSRLSIPFCGCENIRFYSSSSLKTKNHEIDLVCALSTDNMTIAGCLIFDAVFYTLKPDNFTIQFVSHILEIIEPAIVQQQQHQLLLLR